MLGHRVQDVPTSFGAGPVSRLAEVSPTRDADGRRAARSERPRCRRPARFEVPALAATVVDRLGDAPSLRYLLPIRPLRRWVLRRVVRDSLERGRGWTDPAGRSVVVVDPALEEQEVADAGGSWRVALELAAGIVAVVGVAGAGLVVLVGWLFGWLVAVATAWVAPVALAWRPVRVWRAERALGRGVRASERYVHDVARPRDAPPGSARPLLAAVCAVADSDRRSLVLEADQPALVEYYAAFGFTPAAAAVMPWRGNRTLLVREPRTEPREVAAWAKPAEGFLGAEPVAPPAGVSGAPAEAPGCSELDRRARPLGSSRPRA